MRQLELKALAKINLGLDVLGKRENGYHDVRMIMQSIYLYDDVKIERKTAPGIELSSNLFFLPTGDGNIAYKAAQMLIEEFGIEEGVRITLHKHIPVSYTHLDVYKRQISGNGRRRNDSVWKF